MTHSELLNKIEKETDVNRLRNMLIETLDNHGSKSANKDLINNYYSPSNNLKVVKTNQRDVDSFNIEVFENDSTLIAEGSYNVRTNFAHLTVLEAFEDIYDDGELVDKIESRELEIA